MEPIMSSELVSFLMPMGWTIEEFAALRTFGVRPPQDIAAADLNEMAEQNAQVGFLFLIYALSFYRFQKILGWSKLFVPEEKIISIQ